VKITLRRHPRTKIKSLLRVAKKDVIYRPAFKPLAFFYERNSYFGFFLCVLRAVSAISVVKGFECRRYIALDRRVFLVLDG
jgi:hypothetical protein